MGATRILYAILAAQTALVLFLTFQVVSIKARIGDLAEITAVSHAPLPTTHEENAAPRVSAAQTPTPAAATPDQVRDIVRNEMDALAWRILENQGPPRPAVARPAPKPGEAAALNAAIESELGAFIASGRASPTEMAVLQEKIARLPPGEREAALGRLTKAINDGRLDARF